MDRGFSGPVASIFTGEVIGFLAGGLALGAGLTVLLLSSRRKKKTPEELEAQRRAWLSTYGKLGGGEILEVQDDRISFLYGVRGVTYNTSQDITDLQDYLPVDRWSIVGGVGVRYDPRNPANSVVISEKWTGLRQQPGTAGKKGAVSLPRDKRP